MLVFYINVLHGSVARRLRYGEIFHNDFIANLPLTQQLKKFENRSTFGEVTDKSIVGCFFDSQCSHVLVCFLFLISVLVCFVFSLCFCRVYIHICLQLLGVKPPDHHRDSPLDLMGNFRLSDLISPSMYIPGLFANRNKDSDEILKESGRIGAQVARIYESLTET